MVAPIDLQDIISRNSKVDAEQLQESQALREELFKLGVPHPTYRLEGPMDRVPIDLWPGRRIEQGRKSSRIK